MAVGRADSILRVAGAALVAGAILGVGARVLMRIIARLSGLPGSQSTGGSLEVILFGILLGAPIALAFFALRKRVPGRGPWPGLLLGGGTALLLTLLPPPSARSAMAGAILSAPVVSGLFFVLFLGYGAALEWLWRRLTPLP